jgi:uncharacterized protein YjbJ (UPF0337 family)
MSNESKRGEGAAEELGGKFKKVAGQVLGNEQMEAEGRAKELKGEAKQQAAKAAERTEGKVEEVLGAVKNATAPSSATSRCRWRAAPGSSRARRSRRSTNSQGPLQPRRIPSRLQLRFQALRGLRTRMSSSVASESQPGHSPSTS